MYRNHKRAMNELFMDIFSARHSLLNGISGTEGLSFPLVIFFSSSRLSFYLKLTEGRIKIYSWKDLTELVEQKVYLFLL